MTDDELNVISDRWEGVSKGYKRIKFEEAHADMMALLVEIRQLQSANRLLAYKLHNAELMAKNMGHEMLREVEAVVMKYSQRQA